MPSKPRPKTFRATRPFSTGGVQYQPGDVIPHGPLLRQLLQWGGFVTSSKER